MKTRTSSLSHGLKRCHQRQLYLCVSVFQPICCVCVGMCSSGVCFRFCSDRKKIRSDSSYKIVSSKKTNKKKTNNVDFKCECVSRETVCFRVVSEDAVRFCVILMNDCQFCCACVFFVCLYLHSAYLSVVCPYTTPHTQPPPGDETRITKSV